MIDTLDNTEVLASIGRLLAYPQADFHEIFEATRLEVIDVSPPAAEHFERFAEEARAISLDHAQELYTRAFDVNPVCMPYLSVHLFGQDSFKRAVLMTGLKAAYEAAHFDSGTELPDHIALVLQSAPKLPAEDWIELHAYCLEKPLREMLAALERSGSPWRHLVRAVSELVNLGEPEHA